MTSAEFRRLQHATTSTIRHLVAPIEQNAVSGAANWFRGGLVAYQIAALRSAGVVDVDRLTGDANQICAQARRQVLEDPVAALQSSRRARPARRLAAWSSALYDAVR